MSRVRELAALKAHLEKRLVLLKEKSDSYKYLDEEVSDIAAYKAMRIAKKIDLMVYLNM